MPNRLKSGQVVLGASLIFGIALAVRVLVASHDSQILWDELFHLLSARSWVEDGTFSIGDGEYRRSWLFTVLVGETYRLFGESVFVARLPSVIAGAIWVVVAFVWTYAVAGGRAAWIAGLLFCFAPASLFQSQFIRFYALHGLAFFVVSVSWYTIVTRNIGARATALAVAAITISCLVALHLQITTLIGIAALGIWTSIELMRQWSSPTTRTIKLKGLTAMFLLVIAGGIAILMIGDADQIIEQYRSRAVFAAQEATPVNIFAYHQILISQFPTLWSLFPLACLLAIRSFPTPAIFCATTFAFVILIHSFAGRAAERYVAYAMPFFFILWGIVIVGVWPRVQQVAADAASTLSTHLSSKQRSQSVANLLIVCSIAFVILANPAVMKSISYIRQGEQYSTQPTIHWRQASELLGSLIDGADVVLTTNGTYAFYYLGRYDIEISRNIVSQTPDKSEFSVDNRTGRVAISLPESIRSVMSCFETGLFVGHVHQWGHEINGISLEGIEVLTSEAVEISTPPKWRMEVYYWDRPALPKQSFCNELHRLVTSA